MIKVNITSKDSNSKMGTLLKEIANMVVFVGIPQEKSSRKRGVITNAELAYIHTHGSELRNIPARPIIEPAIEVKETKDAIAQELGEAIASKLDRKDQEAMRHLKRAGMMGQNAARAWFEDPRNEWAPDSPSTIARKGSDRPLIDTGQLRKSIIYVVSKDGKT